MAEDFQVGDTVVLKSGSPVMTINHFVEQTGEVICTWIDPKSGEAKRAGFAPETLEKYEGGDEEPLVWRGR